MQKPQSWAWIVNDPELMKQDIEWSMDGIITNQPGLMLKVPGK